MTWEDNDLRAALPDALPKEDHRQLCALSARQAWELSATALDLQQRADFAYSRAVSLLQALPSNGVRVIAAEALVSPSAISQMRGATDGRRRVSCDTLYNIAGAFSRYWDRRAREETANG